MELDKLIIIYKGRVGQNFSQQAALSCANPIHSWESSGFRTDQWPTPERSESLENSTSVCLFEPLVPGPHCINPIHQIKLWKMKRVTQALRGHRGSRKLPWPDNFHGRTRFVCIVTIVTGEIAMRPLWEGTAAYFSSFSHPFFLGKYGSLYPILVINYVHV